MMAPSWFPWEEHFINGATTEKALVTLHLPGEASLMKRSAGSGLVHIGDRQKDHFVEQNNFYCSNLWTIAAQRKVTKFKPENKI